MDKGHLKMMFINGRNKTIDLTSYDFNYTEIEKYLNNIICEYTEKQNINLIISYYKSQNNSRNKEIDLAIKLNLQNKLFNKIIVIDDTGTFHKENENQNENKNQNENIIVVNDNRRLNFNDFFKYANQYTEDNTLNILCNSDIVIGEMFDKIKLDEKEILFLSRYEISLDGKNKLNDDCGSFDTWVWKGKIIEDFGNFRMGIGACDVRLAMEVYEKGYKLKNPSFDLKTYHIHCTNIRYWLTEGNAPGSCLKIKHSKLNDTFSKDNYIFI
jgi:hypothetical protein